MSRQMSRHLPVLFLALVVGCPEAQKSAPLGRSPLFSRLGGNVKIEPLLIDLREAIVHDKRVPQALRTRLQEGNSEEWKHKMAVEIGEISSTGRTFTVQQQEEAVHQLGLTPEEWSAVEDDLQTVLEKHQIREAEREEFKEILAPFLVAILDHEA
jgi:hypothetical protein